jgi:hypothetical protein
VSAVPGRPRGDGGAAAGPALAIVGGRPTAAETAAVVVVLSALASRAQAPGAARPSRSQWSARSRLLRGPVVAGPDAWRGSALPR